MAAARIVAGKIRHQDNEWGLDVDLWESGFRLALAAGFVLAAAAATAAPALAAAGPTLTGSIQVGGAPFAIAVDPLTSAVYTANSAGNYVTNRANNTVSLITN